MDGVLGDVGDGAMSEVDDVMGGDMVALPDFSFDDDHSDVSPRGVASSNRGGVLASSSTGEEGTTANLRGMLKRQDTFGDEFYENWEKVVTVESGSAPPSVNEVCMFEYRRCLLFMMWWQDEQEAAVEVQSGAGGSVSSSKSSSKSKKGGKNNKRMRYHEAVAQQQEEEDRQRAEEKQQLKAVQERDSVSEKSTEARTAVRSAAAPPKMKTGKKK
jgi:hypothetical protein